MISLVFDLIIIASLKDKKTLIKIDADKVIGENTPDVNDNRIPYRTSKKSCSSCGVGSQLSKRELDQIGGNNHRLF